MSTPRPRREGESDASYKAAMVELGKFNERMYGKDSPFYKKQPQPAQPPTIAPRSPRGTGTNDGGPNNAPSSVGGVRPPKGPVKPLRERIADNVTNLVALKQRIEDIRKQIPVRKNKDPVMPKNVRPKEPARPQEPARPMGVDLLAGRGDAPVKGVAEYQGVRLEPPKAGNTTQNSGPRIDSNTFTKVPYGINMAKGGKAPTPVKKAAGGAAKVRKGMMSPEGKILHAMNKIRGK